VGHNLNQNSSSILYFDNKEVMFEAPLIGADTNQEISDALNNGLCGGQSWSPGRECVRVRKCVSCVLKYSDLDFLLCLLFI